jgi:hypothetical protein
LIGARLVIGAIVPERFGTCSKGFGTGSKYFGIIAENRNIGNIVITGVSFANRQSSKSETNRNLQRFILPTLT